MLQFQVPQKGISVLPNDRCVLPAPAGHKEHIADWVEQQMVLKEKESGSGAFKSWVVQHVDKVIKTIPNHILMID